MAPPTEAAVEAALTEMPLMFVENVGQFDDEARFQVQGTGGTLWLADDALWIRAVEPAPLPEPGDGLSDPAHSTAVEEARQGVAPRTEAAT